MNIYDVFPSNYLRAADLHGRPYTLTMREFVIEQMGREEEEKPVLYFEKASKGLVLNKTNAMVIAGLYGPETDAWVSKRITVYPTQVRAFGKMQDAIRVRGEIPAAPMVSAGESDPSEEPAEHEQLGVESELLGETDVERESDPFSDPTAGAMAQQNTGREIELLGNMPTWRGPLDAQMWAMENGTCANEHEARNSWKKIVVALGGFGPENATQAYQQFFARQLEKLQAA